MAERETLTVVRRSDDDKLRDHCEHSFSAMMGERGEQSKDWYDIAGLCMPHRSKPLVECRKTKDASASNKRVTLYDDHALRAVEICANGMLSGASSRARPWLKAKLADDNLMRSHAVRAWCDEVTGKALWALGMSNFYEAALAIYLEMTGFGTGGNVMLGDEESVLVNHPLTAGEYGLAIGENGRPNALSRTYTLTAQQMVERYVTDAFDRREMHWDRVTQPVKEAWDRSNYSARFPINHLIELNPAYVPGRIGRIGQRWRAMKWQPEDNDRKRFLAIEGFHEQPFMAPRWSTLSGETWGTGRGHMALPSMRQLQLAAKRSGHATHMAVQPPTMGPPGIDRAGMLPGNHTTVAVADLGSSGIQTIYEIPYQVVRMAEDQTSLRQRQVDRMFYVDLFMAITNMEGVQPRNIEELARRHEEQLTQLGPVTDRINLEFLQLAFDRVFGILNRAGMIPEAPEEIQGMGIQVDFTGILMQAQRLLGVSQLERSVGFVGNLAAAFPEAGDNLDVDQIVHNHWERTGAPSVGLRDPKIRDAIRAKRAQQQEAERMAAMMPAAKDGADAARLLSETDLNGNSVLERLAL